MVKKKEEVKKPVAVVKPGGAKLTSFLKHVEKKYGPEAAGKPKVRKFIKSSSFKFDRIMGGGWLRGRIYELFGPEGGGKTTIALDAVQNAQKQYSELSTLYLDKEHGLDEARMTNLGVDVSKCEKDIDPKTAEETLDVLTDAIKSDAFSIAILDSIAILEPEAERVDSKGEEVGIKEASNKMGLQGKMMSTAMRRMVQAAYDHDVCVIFINQLRDKLNPYGPKEETPGGRAVKFAASVRVNVHPVSGKDNKYMKDGEQIGHKIAMQTVKNRLAPPMRTAEIDLYYSSPLDTVGEVISLALEFDILTKTGHTYYFGQDNKIAGSAIELKQLLISDFNLRSQITAEVEKVIDTVIHKERAAEKIDLDKPVVAKEEIPEDVMEGAPSGEPEEEKPGTDNDL
jgi:recombination protein RecA